MAKSLVLQLQSFFLESLTLKNRSEAAFVCALWLQALLHTRGCSGCSLWPNQPSLCDGVQCAVWAVWQCSAVPPRSGQEPEGVANQPDCRRIHLEALNALSFRQKNVLGFSHPPRALSHHVYQREWLSSSFFTWSSNCSVPRLSCQARWLYLQKGS